MSRQLKQFIKPAATISSFYQFSFMRYTAIKVENVSKQYRLGQVGTGTLRHDMNRLWHSIRGKEDPYIKIGQVNDRTKKAESEFVWALKDINFEVKQGEVIGIIGRNGAGKSTLLKILGKITSPTTGEIKIKGRMASLLEVGTGFHPELTGRENVFMNGAVLGMRKWEIQKKFDEIVDFAGLTAYIDTPVKRYSSGMKVRLGFAVAAFLKNEILVVDEVLAVGDSEFQKKCIDRMLELTRDGRTVLFVSHNLSSIRSLCQRGIILENGTLTFDNNIQLALDKYTSQNAYFNQEFDLLQAKRGKFAGGIKFSKLRLIDKQVEFGKDIVFDLELIAFMPELLREDIDLTLAINDLDGVHMMHIGNRFVHQRIQMEEKLLFRVSLENKLRGGVYSIALNVNCRNTTQDFIDEQIYFEVLEGNPYNYYDSSVLYGRFMGDFSFVPQKSFAPLSND